MLETTITVYYYTNKRYPFERKKKSKITPTQFTTTTNEHDPLIFWHWRRKRKRKRKKSFLCWELIAHSCEMKSKTWKMMESRKLGTSKHKKWDPLQLYLRRTDTIQHNLQCFHDRKGKKKTLVANNISHGKYNKCFSFSAEKFLCFSFIFLFFFSLSLSSFYRVQWSLVHIGICLDSWKIESVCGKNHNKETLVISKIL